MKIHPTIQKPCTKDWDSLSGGQKQRFCSECQHHVHDLDALTPAEQSRLLQSPGHHCVAYSNTMGPTGMSDYFPGDWSIVSKGLSKRPLVRGTSYRLVVEFTGDLKQFLRDYRPASIDVARSFENNIGM